MSSFAELKELALQRAGVEEAARIKEREVTEREAAAKRAAREEEERAQRDRERKIMVQKMTRQKEEEAREKARKEQAIKLAQMKAEEMSKPRPSAALLPKKKTSASEGSTHKVDLSDMSAKRNAAPVKRKSRIAEDDFVGNRFERKEKAARSSTSTAKRKAVPLTREEKQAIKRAKEFGGLPRSNTAHRPAFDFPPVRAPMSKSNQLVALGTKKKDQRTIDEIERDLRKLKDSPGRSHTELAREAAALRRQKAMEQKRIADKGLESENGIGTSDDDSGGSIRNRNGKASKPAASTKDSDRSQTNGNDSRIAPATKVTSPVRARDSNVVNPADFLPGAPLNARLTQRTKTPNTAAAKTADADVRAPKKKKTEDAAGASTAAPPRRETARDRFIREQAIKSAAASSKQSSRTASSRQDQSDESGSEQEDSYDSEDDDEEEEDEAGDVRDEIWAMFGKDRRAYTARVVDSDDDMEADAGSVLQEELRSAKQAREEDQREEQRERQREREKALRKQGKSR